MTLHQYRQEVALKLTQTDTELDTIFATIKIKAKLEAQLKGIKQYFNQLMRKASSESELDLILSEYEHLVLMLKTVKNGQITAEEALKEIEEITWYKKVGIVLNNILNLCELLFWATAAAAAYVGCVFFGLPIMCVDPLFGTALTLATAGVFLIAASETIDCMDEFQSFAEANAEDIREKNVLSFFSPATSSKATQTYSPEDSSDDSLTANCAY